MQENFKIKKELPKDFPLPTVFTKEEVIEREGKKEMAGLSSETGEDFFFLDNNGTLDEKFIINSWYQSKNAKKPEDVEIKNCEQLTNVRFREFFNRPGAFEKMMSQPDNDPKKEKVLNFIVEMVMRTLSDETRKKIKDNNLEKQFEDLLTNQAKMDAFFLANKEEMKKEGSGKNEEFERIILDVAELKAALQDFLFKNHIV